MVAPRFRDLMTDRDARFSLGLDTATDEPYLAIAVSNRLVDYEEYFRLTWDELHRFQRDPAAARTFAEACRARAHDHRLILPPGSDRGEAR